MSTYVGRNCKVTVGTDTVAGMGTWSMDGIVVDQIDTTSFGQVQKTFEAGMQDGGQITFDGWYDATDTNGQVALRLANLNGTHITTLRLYVNNTSYWTPKTTNPLSYIIVTSYTVSVATADVVKSKFTCKVSGSMEIL
jgi:hypothetical protein